MRNTATLLVSLALLLTLGFALQKNTNLRLLRTEVARLEVAIAEERSRLAVLRVDYANITRIARLEELAKRFLPHLQAAKTAQVRVLEARDGREELRAAEEPQPSEQALSYETIR